MLLGIKGLPFLLFFETTVVLPTLELSAEAKLLLEGVIRAYCIVSDVDVDILIDLPDNGKTLRITWLTDLTRPEADFLHFEGYLVYDSDCNSVSGPYKSEDAFTENPRLHGMTLESLGLWPLDDELEQCFFLDWGQGMRPASFDLFPDRSRECSSLQLTASLRGSG